MRKTLLLAVLLLSVTVAPAQKKAARPAAKKAAAPTTEEACAPCIRAEEAFLASDALRGRGSGSHDEELAANYVGSELQRFGIEPAGDDGGFVQKATIVTRTAAAPPVVGYSVGGQETHWTHGQQVLVASMPAEKITGPLQKPGAQATVQKGAIVLLADTGAAVAAVENGAAAALVPASPRVLQSWQQRAQRLPRIGDASMGPASLVLLNQEAAAALASVPEGTSVTIEAQAGPEQKQYTWNAVGILKGSDPKLAGQAVLLSAHLDHLGVAGEGQCQAVGGDSICNGADDDASGTVAVLQMARALGSGEKPKRTVVFALFGSEERGGLGSNFFLDHAPVTLTSIVANLEFEMIGRPDPKYKPDELWLTGWERSNLGPTLAQHGAKLVADERPEQNFFARSDNIVLAKRGVVAQTVSSFGLHTDYHRPSDDVQHIDFEHMTRAIGSMIGPVRWLVNSDFTPAWNPGKKP